MQLTFLVAVDVQRYSGVLLSHLLSFTNSRHFVLRMDLVNPCLVRDRVDVGGLVDLSQIEHEHKQAVKHIDKEIEVLMRKVRQLQFQKSQHEQKIKYYQGMRTLARRLPPEILACIVEECVHDGWTRTPLTASHVCWEWRGALLQIPAVWSHVYVNLDGKDPCRRTRFWLRNAAKSLLDISLEIKNDITHLASIMDLLLNQIAQWRTLAVHSVRLDHANYVFALCDRTALELQAVDISVLEESSRDDLANAEADNLNLGLFHAFPEAPQFHTVCIRHNLFPAKGTIPSSISSLRVILPVYNTQSVLSIDAALDLLDSLPLLRNFSVVLEQGHEREVQAASEQHRLVFLPALQTVSLLGSWSVFKLLPHLSTPELHSLHLRSSIDPLGYPEAKPGSFITTFIQQSTPWLRVLELHDVDLPFSDFIVCFAGLPTLRELRLHESDISDAVIHQLHGPYWLCPMLSRLHLHWCGQVTGRALVELAQARRMASRGNGGTTVEPMEMMTIINCSFVSERDIMKLAELTVCRVVVQSDSYCYSLGCCQNERYRRRLHLRQWCNATQRRLIV